MFPIVLSPGPTGTLVTNVLVVIAWLVFSFLFWRGLRHYAVEEDRIFDLTFYATLMAFLAARAGFVVSHWELFAGKSVLLLAALWVSPGLSWLAGLVGGVAALVALSRGYKVRLGLVLDALAAALPLPIILGLAGSFFSVGERNLLRHPVQFYEMIALIGISLVTYRLGAMSIRNKWPYGLVGVWFFLLYAVASFALEFLKGSRVYWGELTANQWMLIGIFAESLGVLYVRGGGREYLRPLLHKVIRFVDEKRRKIYESISQRHAH